MPANPVQQCHTGCTHVRQVTCCERHKLLLWQFRLWVGADQQACDAMSLCMHDVAGPILGPSWMMVRLDSQHIIGQKLVSQRGANTCRACMLSLAWSCSKVMSPLILLRLNWLIRRASSKSSLSCTVRTAASETLHREDCLVLDAEWMHQAPRAWRDALHT